MRFQNFTNSEIMKKGQALIEILIALVIITMIFISFSALSVRSIKLGILSKQRIEANGYAQQGIEIIKNIRDTNLSKDDPFSKDILPEGDKIIKQKNSNPKFGWKLVDDSLGKGETKNGFTRYIKIIEKDSDTLEVNVKITWEDGKHQTQLVSQITDWKK